MGLGGAVMLVRRVADGYRGGLHQARTSASADCGLRTADCPAS